MQHILAVYLLVGGAFLTILILFPLGKKEAQDQLRSIGLVNHTDMVPALKRKYKDKQNPLISVWEFSSQGIPLKTWEDKQAGKMWDNQFGLVFTDALGKYLVRRTVVKHFKKISQRAGISDDARFHDLRHSFAVSSLYAGDDIKTVQANLGHATAQFTLDVYGHVTQKMRQDSANRMQKFYEQLSFENAQ